MTRRTGVDATTVNFVTFGPGECFIDYGEAGERQLGATDGGCECNIDRAVRQIAFDGTIAPVVGSDRVQAVIARLTVNLKDIISADVGLAIAGGNIAANVPVGWDRITGGEIEAGDYLTNVVLICEHSSLGNDVIFWVYNAIAQPPLAAVMNNDGEWVLPIVFEGRVTGAAPNTEPWAIDYPLA